MNSYKGFTLIELMVVVAIVGILASIAIPSYQDSVRKSRRADAKGALLNFANSMERHFTEVNSYCDAANGGTQVAGCVINGSTVGDTGTPSIYTPPPETARYYSFTIDNNVTQMTYKIRATRVSTSPQANDKCGDLTITNTGLKDMDNEVSGLQPQDCWG